MSVLKKNIVANFAGSIWQTLMGLAFIPLYIKFLGIESYGLIGVFATLQGVFTILDMGLSATLTREIARLSVLPGKEREMHNLVRTLEIIYWCIALFIGTIVISITPFLAQHWFIAKTISTKSIEQALLIMGFVMVFRWPASFYSGGLIGLERQILLNLINMGMSTLGGVGVIVILWLISPTLQAFFLWQLSISVINICLLAILLKHRLPKTQHRVYFDKKLLIGIWRYAAGVAGISFMGMLMTQLDKIILSKMLSLEMFAYYTLAGTVAISLYRIINPVSNGIFPRITHLVALDDKVGLAQFYHKSCQVMSVLIIPVTVIIAVFSKEILLIWTQNPVTAENTHLLVSVLICGTALNGLCNIPYITQLANGWTKLGLITNFISVILIVPLIIFMATHYGALGGAMAWVILNGGYVLIGIQFMHRRLLTSEKWRWYWQDISLPVLTSLIIAGLGRLILGTQSSQLVTLIYLGLISFSTLIATAIATPATRFIFLNKLADLKLLKNIK